MNFIFNKYLPQLEMENKLKWIVLDAWGVIYKIGQLVDNILIPYIKRSKPEINDLRIYQEYYRASKGIIDSQVFWNNLGFKDPEKTENNYISKIDCFNYSFIDFTDKIKDKFRLALLTNDVEAWAKKLLKKFQIIDRFDIIVISGEIGHRKPEKEMYEILLSKIQEIPSNCVFIDDTMKNLVVASELGFKTIRFINRDSKITFCSEFEVNNFNELLEVINNFY